MPAPGAGTRAAGKDKEKALIEYEDMKDLLKENDKGKTFIAFGSAFSEQLGVSLLDSAEKARLSQSPYPLKHGLTKLRTPSDREPARGTGEQNPVLVLQEFQAAKDKEEGQKKQDGKAP